jgi:DNA-directed RNA polymerase subunit RPC12/RpoP
MSEILAQPKFSCPACGAEARWDAGKQALICPYCGTQSAAELSGDGGAIEEHDLALALRSAGDDRRGWDPGRQAVRCGSCRAITVFPPERTGQRCEFCGSTQLVPVEEKTAPIRPESVLPFRVAEPELREQLRRWYGSHWFAPGRLKRGAMTDVVHGIYIPYWTFDARVEADWTAEAGHYYNVTERVRGADGRTVSRQVQKIRWEPAAGHLSHFFDDELVAASVGLPADLLGQIEPFPTGDLVPYDAGYLSGWVVEQYQIDLVAAASAARDRMGQKLERLCAGEVPGDTHRNLSVAADYGGQTFKHILAPVWSATYQFGSKTYFVLVNGFTGKIAGRYPISWIKVALSIAIFLVILFTLIGLSESWTN